MFYYQLSLLLGTFVEHKVFLVPSIAVILAIRWPKQRCRVVPYLRCMSSDIGALGNVDLSGLLSNNLNVGFSMTRAVSLQSLC